MSVEARRAELLRWVRAKPFEPFVIVFEGGEYTLVDCPEMIAFDPEPRGAKDFGTIGRRGRLLAELASITRIAPFKPAEAY